MWSAYVVVVCHKMLLCGEDSVDQVEQTIKGCAVLSKRALDVMSCEVNRLLTLTASYIIQFSYCVPRKVKLLCGFSVELKQKQ